MKWTIGKKIGAGFSLALVAIVIIGAVSYWSTAKLTSTAEWVQHTHQVLAGLESILSSLKDTETGQRGYLLTGEERYLEPYHSGKAAIQQKLSEVRKLTKDNTNQQRRLNSLEPLIESKLAELQETIDLRKDETKGLDAALQVVRTDKGKKIMDEIRKLTTEMQDEENELLKGRSAEAQSAVTLTQYTIFLGTALSFALLAFAGVSITRNVTSNLSSLIGQMEKSGIQVTTSATELAATGKEQQATANEISSTTTEISATAKEISATAKELVKTMKEVAGVAEETAVLAGNGQSGLIRMETTTRQIMDASGSINSRLAVLSEKAGNINTVITTIAKVADQTNLLSLNAAIEAEKAGEYGRGFAVVATEIRRLADQTAAATSDIEQMVKEMQSAVSAGVMGMDKFSEEVRRGVEVVGQVSQQLNQIIDKVQTLTPNFEAVNEGMQSQSAGAQQISEALSQLTETAQQTVESLQQSNSAVQQLTEVTSGLRSAVTQIKSEI